MLQHAFRTPVRTSDLSFPSTNQHEFKRHGPALNEYKAMESGLIEAIRKLQQLATPPPEKPTSATKIPMFLSNHERIQSIIQSFVNRTINKDAEEKEETPNASGLTKQQEMIYATE